jgi:hypothetical protein
MTYGTEPMAEQLLAELDEKVEPLEAKLAELEAEVERRQIGSRHPFRFGNIYAKIDQVEEHLLRARARANANPNRPELCWCRGTGGLGYLQVEDPGEPEVRKYICQMHCSCPEGDKRRHADNDLTNAIEKRQRQIRVQKWLDELSPGWRAFRKHTLESYPVDVPEQRAVIAQLRNWQKDDYRCSQCPPDVAKCSHELDEMPRYLYLHGPVGRGKTGLAFSLAKLFAAEDYRVVVVDVVGLLGRIRRTYSKGAGEIEGDIMRELQQAEILILDDFGTERITESGWVTEHLFELVNYWYGKYDPDGIDRLIVTSNLTISELAKHIGDIDGERIAWRLGERSLVVSLDDCPNLRMPKGRGPSMLPATGPGDDPVNVVQMKRGVA